MKNPHAINIHCDGAMDYDTNHTGGNGFIIEFPDDFNLGPILKSIRIDGYEIHQIEIISILEAMDELLSFYKRCPETPCCSSGVLIFTDRFSVPDLLNPYRIKEYRKYNKWINYEGKAIKDKDLIDRIDKTRTKLSHVVGGRIEINYESRKNNRIANNLSHAGKKILTTSKKFLLKKSKRVNKRKYDGTEISYSTLKEGDILNVRMYAWEMISKQYELSVEVYEGSFLGQTIKISIDKEMKNKLHLSYCYLISVKKIYRHHIQIDLLKEVGKKYKENKKL
jgi:ribonuclease HI